MKTPAGYRRLGFRMSDPKSLARFVEYARIRNFKLFNLNKIEEIYDFFGKDLHSTLRCGWRENKCGQGLAVFEGDPHRKMDRKKSTWLEKFLRRDK